MNSPTAIHSAIPKLGYGAAFAFLKARMRVRLTKKLADALNGCDLTRYVVGEVVDLPESFARMLLAEDWAEPVMIDLATAADRSPRTRR